MMMWVKKYDTVILKITIHTGFTKQGLQNTLSIYWRNMWPALQENILETQNHRLSGKGISSPALLPAHAIQYRTIIARVEDTQNTKELEG